MEQIKAGQWWETKDGKRIHILADADIPGVRPRNDNIIAIRQEGHIETYRKDGQYYNDQASTSDLAVLLPSECDGFDWKPEPKWRDARPEDAVRPCRSARFRDTGNDDWQPGMLSGFSYSEKHDLWEQDGMVWWKVCQVKDE